MKKTILAFAVALIFVGISPILSNAKPPKEEAEKELTEAEMQKVLAEYAKKFTYQTGAVNLGDKIATLNVPAGFKFMDATQSKDVVTNLWGNPADDKILGMLLPEKSTPLDTNMFAFIITFDPMGYVKDDDADKIDYNNLLKDMQSGEQEANAERVKMGYPSIHMVGWASAPFYDKERKALHWAKELSFDGNKNHTLNYDIRILGRNGVLSFNAVGEMSALAQIKPAINTVIGGANFSEGNRYSDFNPSIDKVAGLTVGGLVAGKVLAKVGFFAIILKYLKFIVLGIAAVGGSIWRAITGKKEEEAPDFAENNAELDENGNPKA